MYTLFKSIKTRELNIIIIGENTDENCIIGNMLAATQFHQNRYFDPKFIVKRNSTVRVVWSSYLISTKLKIIVAPCKDSPTFLDLLNRMKGFRHRYILCVLNCERNKGDGVLTFEQLVEKFGTHKTKYIPIVYRDLQRIGQPATQQELQFLQKFPHTHYHAPVLTSGSEQKLLPQNILLDYVKYVTQRAEPSVFREYNADMFLCCDMNTVSVASPSEDDTVSPSNDVETSTNCLDSSTESSLESDISDGDLDLYIEAVHEGVAKSHHVRVMVVGPNGAGKTTLIKRLQQERVCCDGFQPPTEGIDIVKTQIRCRIVEGAMEWETEKEENDFKQKLSTQRIATAMNEIEKGNVSRWSSLLNVNSAYHGMHSKQTDEDWQNLNRSGSQVTIYPNDITTDATSDDGSINFDDSAFQDRFFSQTLKNNVSKDDLDSSNGRVSETKENNLNLDNSKSTEISIYEKEQFIIDDEESATAKHHDDNDGSSYQLTEAQERFFRDAVWHREHLKVPWIYCTFWDFAGHAAYYSTHQLFMSSSVIYLLVVDISKDLDSPIDNMPDSKEIGMFQMTEKESIKFWLGSIQQYAGDTDVGIGLVFTHKDRIVESSMISQKIRLLFEDLKVELPSFVVDNTECSQDENDDLYSLMHFIESSANQISDTEIPTKWILLNNIIENKVEEGMSVVTFEQLIEEFSSYRYEEETTSFLHHQHLRGELLFYPKENAVLRTSGTDSACSQRGSNRRIDQTTPIFIDPMVLIRFINYILKRRPKDSFQIGLRTQNISYSAEGVMDDKYLDTILKNMSDPRLTENKIHLIRQLLEMHILFKISDDTRDCFFMPCLLRQTPPPNVNYFQGATEKTPILVIRFNISYISHSVFHQLVAALHKYYKPHKLNVNNVDTMQFYCGFISLQLSASGLQQLQLTWKPNGIHLTIINFAKRSLDTISKRGITLCHAALNTTLDCLNEVLSLYRNSPDYELMVICPTHFMSPTLVPFDILVEEGGYLCPSESPHEVTVEKALKFWITPSFSVQRPVTPTSKHSACPTCKDIARISLYLDVNVHVLAHVLKIKDSTTEVLRIEHQYKDSRMQVFQLLLKWKQENGRNASFGILKKRLGQLIKLCEGDWIGRIVTEELQIGAYGLPTAVLEKIPDDKYLHGIARRLLPTSCDFMFLEFGLSFAEIEQAKEQYRQFDTQTFELLKLWKQEIVEKATFQVLLDTANYVGMDVSTLVEYVRQISNSE